MKTTFWEWLKKQTHRDDVIGDFAKDAYSDAPGSDLPTRRDWRRYLKNGNACKEALQAFEDAWEEWEKP